VAVTEKSREKALQDRIAALEQALADQQAELKRLYSREALYRDVIEGTEDLVTRVDGHGRFVYVNRAGEKILGCPVGQCPGQQALDYIHPFDRDAARAEFEEWIRTGRTNRTFETRLVNQTTGAVFDMLCTVNLSYDAAGKLTGINSIARNLTARKRREKELKALTRKLSQRVKELRCLYEISKLREKQDFSLDEIIQQIVELIPSSLRYPDIACAQVRFEGYAHRTANFRSTPWQISRRIKIHNDPACVLEVGYLEEQPDWKGRPFIDEEQDLVNAVAERISNIVEREWAEIELRDYREQLEAMLSRRTAELRLAEDRLQREIKRRKKAEKALLDMDAEK
jgi:PAS domain S-box-containing protein